MIQNAILFCNPRSRAREGPKLAAHNECRSGDEAGFVPAQERHRAGDIRRCCQTAHRRPATLVALPNRLLGLIGQVVDDGRVERAGLTEHKAGTDTVDGDAARPQCHREVPHQGLHCCLDRPHRRPGLPAAIVGAGRVAGRDDPPAVAKQICRGLHGDQEGSCLAVHRHVLGPAGHLER
jgi:hypothetical protein